MVRSFLSWIVVSVLVCFSWAGRPCLAQNPQPIMAPLNPEFERYVQDVASGKVRVTMTESGHMLGLVPDPLDRSHLKGQDVFPVKAAATFDPYYDLRALGRVTPVKDQNPCGTCWAFAAMGSLESCLMPAEEWDFSENNLKNRHGFDYECCNGGGDTTMSVAYLARWDGPVTEADDPYDTSSCSSPADAAVQKHVQQVIYLPSKQDPLDNNNIKQAVVAYGAVTTYLQWLDICYNPTAHSYYYDGQLASNHLVCIVGWDDNYDRNRFAKVPPGNGAYIVRNSWGANWGEGGYFYLSYHDTVAGLVNDVYMSAEPPTEFTQIYQYDPLGYTSAAGYKGSTTAWCANVFTAEADEEIAAIAFYTPTVYSGYEFYVYSGANEGPTSGTLIAHGQGMAPQAGYQTISFLPAEVIAGSKFSVVLRLSTPGYAFPVPTEAPLPGFSSKATASLGQSYVSYDGSYWDDLPTLSGFHNTNVCLKAFARPAKPRELVTNIDSLLVPEGRTATFQVKLNKKPPSSVTVSVARTDGDTDISVQSGASLSFTTSNWDSYQTVTLTAAEDADLEDGAATITCVATGWESKEVTATEIDNDVPMSILEIKGKPDGSNVNSIGTTVSAVIGDEFYLEEIDRSTGILVHYPLHGLSAGMAANVSGTVETNADGERYIEAATVLANGTGFISPIGLNSSVLGGADAICNPVTGMGQTGVTGGCGPNNIGLLVKTWGRITHTGADFFYLDDGKGLGDGSGYTGVRAETAGFDPPPKSAYAQVTGVSSCVRSGAQIARKLRVPSRADVYLPTGGAITGTVLRRDSKVRGYYAETTHPYANNYYYTWTVIGPDNASWMCVYFMQIQLESGADFLYVTSPRGTVFETWDNDEPAYGVWSAWVPGNMITLHLLTNDSVQRYGFRVTAYAAWVPGPPLEGVTILLEPGGRSTQTDSDGNYTFHSLATGQYMVKPTMPDAVFRPANAVVPVIYGQYETGIDFAKD